jgi:hypothetical protein
LCARRSWCEELYRDDGVYSYGSGWNMAALVAFVIGVLPNIPGFLNAAFPASFPTWRKASRTSIPTHGSWARHFRRRVWRHDEGKVAALQQARA